MMRPERRTFPTLAAKEAADSAAVMVEAQVEVAVAAAVIPVDGAARIPAGRNRISAAGKPS